MNEDIGIRMKGCYEDSTRIVLPRRSYTIIRVDGKAFHTYTRGLKQPFDDGLMNDMDSTASYLCKNIMGAKFAFVQSDEISVLITDFEDINSQAWFGNCLQKMCSVSASMATARFNQLRMIRMVHEVDGGIGSNYHADDVLTVCDIEDTRLAEFDSRVFQIPQKTEVENYFIWRQQDTTRNSISSVAQSLYSHKQLNGKNTSEMQEMIFQNGINWNDYAPKYKRGRLIVKETYVKEPDEQGGVKSESSLRTRWISTEPPIFTQNKDFLFNIIPNNL